MTVSKSDQSPELQPPEMVSCKVCQRHIPADEALHEEAEDYVHWFCGRDCHKKWRGPDKK